MHLLSDDVGFRVRVELNTGVQSICMGRDTASPIPVPTDFVAKSAALISGNDNAVGADNVHRLAAGTVIVPLRTKPYAPRNQIFMLVRVIIFSVVLLFVKSALIVSVALDTKLYESPDSLSGAVHPPMLTSRLKILTGKPSYIQV